MKKARQVEIPTDRPLTAHEVEELLQHAYNSSVWQITNYSRTSPQLREKLYAKGYPKETITFASHEGTLHTVNLVEETLQKLTEGELVDDSRFAKEFIRAKQNAGLGINRIRLLLLQKQLPIELINKLLEEKDVTANNEALEKAFTRYVSSSTFRNTSDEYKKRNKLIQHLLSKGFSYDDISEKVTEYFDWD